MRRPFARVSRATPAFVLTRGSRRGLRARREALFVYARSSAGLDRLRHREALAPSRGQEHRFTARAAADEGNQVCRLPEYRHHRAVVVAVHGFGKARSLRLAAILHETPRLAGAFEQRVLEVTLAPAGSGDVLRVLDAEDENGVALRVEVVDPE